MPRTLTTTQQANTTADKVKPVYLVDWAHSGMQELIALTQGEVVYDGMTFSPGDVRLTQIDNGRTATLSMPASAARISQVQDGTWRGSNCKIYYVPAVPGDALSFVEADAIIVMDGEIRTSQKSGGDIVVNVQHINLGVKLAPRHTFDAIGNHIPAPGTVITWEGDQVVLEQVR